MLLKAADFRGIGGVEPGSGGKLDYTRPNRRGHHYPGQACATVIVDANHVPIGNTPRRGVLRMHPQRFAASDLGAAADGPAIELTVQPVAWLIRQEV
jgi:hypothetical protein